MKQFSINYLILYKDIGHIYSTIVISSRNDRIRFVDTFTIGVVVVDSFSTGEGNICLLIGYIFIVDVHIFTFSFLFCV